ncbi:MAG: DNA/RNA helicase domain-containing protein [Planctomycetota bacterium]
MLQRIEQSKYRPSKKLMDHVGNIIKGKSEYILLDEQLVVYDKVLTCAKKGFHDKQKTAIIIKGGPGTGKSVIAINLMADLLLKGYNSHYATGSKAFTETLRNVIGPRGSSQFKYFNSYTKAESNEIDVLICDESHRIRKTSANRFTKKEDRSSTPQIEELLKASKVAVFLIDDYQIVRPNEIGSVDYLTKYAGIQNCNIFEYELEAQFRCNGSDAFVNWVNNTLEIKRTANVLWDQSDDFDFKIFNTPHELKKALDEKNRAKKNSARLATGFCWPWSEPNSDGTLVNDVVIGDFKMPWEKKTKFGEWAMNDNGMEQVGTVYTAQGFEFDYMGVIFGHDLTYNFDTQSWDGHKDRSSDGVVKRSKEQFVDFLKNTYRVLLSRGLKGCYVYFMDKDTERFFKSRMELPKKIEEEKKLELLAVVPDNQKYKQYLPVYSLKAAAGKFGEGSEVSEEGWMAVNINKKLDNNMFVAKVVGHSMEPRIPGSSHCVFRKYIGGSRQGLIVLAQHHEIHDPETGGSYTVKKYQSEKKVNDDGTWQHTKIILESINKEYGVIDLSKYQEDEIKIIAELVSVL